MVDHFDDFPLVNDAGMQTSKKYLDLDWFSLQNQVRGMVSKLISPVVTQSNEDRDTVKMLRNMNAHLKKKMDELSFAFHKST